MFAHATGLKSLKSYLHKIDPQNHPSPLCPLCNTQNHDTKHLFTCSSLPTHLTSTDLWNDPVAMTGLLSFWDDAVRAAGAVRDPGWCNGDRDGRNTTTAGNGLERIGWQRMAMAMATCNGWQRLATARRC